MGLDTVELVLAVEERFGIELPDEELYIATVGDLLDLVTRKYTEKYPETCQTGECAAQKTFYHIRKCMVDALAIEKQGIRPDTPTSDIFPPESRKTTWKKAAKAAGVKFPALDLPPVFNFLTKVFTFSCWVAMVGIFIAFRFITDLPSGIWYGLLSFLIVILLFVLITLLVKVFIASRAIPASCSTMAGLSRSVMYGNLDKFRPCREEEIRDALYDLIAANCGIPPRISPVTQRSKNCFPENTSKP